MTVAAAKKSTAKRRSPPKKAVRKSATKRRTSRSAAKKVSRKTSATRREKDPRGGLTAAGRKKFAQTQGAHLRPGVTKTISEMTLVEMKRKGSWAVRFYGRKPLPPLVDKHGRPTRLALSAHAWGEPVPRTPAAARKIAAKGRRLLAKYQRLNQTKRSRR
jgi:hypothetical protein